MKASSPPSHVGDIVAALLSERGYLSVCQEYQAVHRWAEIVGDKIAQHATCDRVEDGVLYVRVASASWRQEISYLKHTILETVKTVTGCKTIRDIVLY